MSFLDDLENNLKSLESAAEGREALERQERFRERDRAAAQAAAPWAEELKKSPFTGELLHQAARVGFSLRVKVHVAWLGSTLRLEARERRLELRPTPSGIVAAYLEGPREIRAEPLDLAGSPEALLRAWLE
jgi:hypothetical protein